MHEPGCPFAVALEPLFAVSAVDLVLQGHEHCYERTHAVFNGTVVTRADANGTYVSPRAPVYIVQGSSGAMQRETFVAPPPAWSAVAVDQIYGFGRLAFSGATSLRYEFVDTTGAVRDAWGITKPAPQ